MGGAGRGARVVPTEESKTETAPSSQPAAAFTAVVPVDHAADDPESGAFGPALADASAGSNAGGPEYVIHPRAECVLPWLWSARVAVG